jgi:pimeloyl-ACP methyl ester carboxylesterase
VAPDWPGFGEADKPADVDYSAGTYSAFLTCLFNVLEIKRTHLVMHDLGGVALVWGLGHPEAFRSCVLMGTGVLRDFKWHPVARLYRARPVGEILSALTNRLGFKLTMRLYNPQPRKLPTEIIDRWWANYSLPTRRAALCFYRATPPEGMERLAAPLRELDVPCLVAFGAHDPAVPVEQAERQRESFPSAEVVTLSNSGHWPYLDDPERAAAAIVPFLEQQVARPREASSV